MGKKNKKRRHNQYNYGYRNNDFYNNLIPYSYNMVKSEEINKIALEVFGSLHFTLDAAD
jgi:hypothetical protein